MSHDRSFLDGVITDVLVLADKKLTVFPGTMSDYETRQEEKAAHTGRMLDAKARKEKHVQVVWWRSSRRRRIGTVESVAASIQ